MEFLKHRVCKASSFWKIEFLKHQVFETSSFLKYRVFEKSSFWSIEFFEYLVFQVRIFDFFEFFTKSPTIISVIHAVPQISHNFKMEGSPAKKQKQTTPMAITPPPLKRSYAAVVRNNINSSNNNLVNSKKMTLDTKVRFFQNSNSFVILTTFEFFRQKLDTYFFENSTFHSKPNLKWCIFDHFYHTKLYFELNLTCWNVNFSENCTSFWREYSNVVKISLNKCDF